MNAWVNPLCRGSAEAGPPAGEPFVTSGPTELVSGLYLAGGPLSVRSAPRCSTLSGTPGAGTITVSDAVTETTVATQTVAAGQLARIPLPPGTYVVVGTFANAFDNSVHIQSSPLRVVIAPGKTVRQDVAVGIR